MRGWTLQELLAPRDIEFYSYDWTLLGTKSSLCTCISSITNINTKYLWEKSFGNWYTVNPKIINPSSEFDSEPERQGDRYVAQSITYSNSLREASIAERLSWLSKRTTTRVEDMAYCMLGIFNINMPLLYGEGSNAFWRL